MNKDAASYREAGRITFDHLGMWTANPRRALNFYQKLGFKKEYQGLLPKNVVYPIFKINEDCNIVKLMRDKLCLEIFWFTPTPKSCAAAFKNTRMAGYNHLGLRIRDRERFCGSLSRKFKIKVIKIKRGGHYNYFIRDPDKNLIELKEKAETK